MRGPMETKKQHHQAQKQQIDHGDGPAAPMQKFFQARHHRTHQVGKENGKQESDQGCPAT